MYLVPRKDDRLWEDYAGKLAERAYLEIQAQYASEELNLVNAENQLAISLLNLQQTLDLPIDAAFDVIIPVLADPDENPMVKGASENNLQDVVPLGTPIRLGKDRPNHMDLILGQGSVVPSAEVVVDYTQGMSFKAQCGAHQVLIDCFWHVVLNHSPL